MLESLGNIGDFLGGIGVVVTLAYLAVQIRQNTKATRVGTVQDLIGASMSLNANLVAGPMPQIGLKIEQPLFRPLWEARLNKGYPPEFREYIELQMRGSG